MEAQTVIVKFAGIAKEFSVSNLALCTTVFNPLYIASSEILYPFGFLLAVLFGGRIAYKWKINLDKMIDVLLYGTIGGIVGARLYYVAFKWDYYGQHLSDIFKIWEGGLAIYGGIIGGILAAFIVCRIEKLNFFNLLDMVSMSLLIGQGIGRWGNYANQEAFGSLTNKNWGMMSDTVAEYISRNASYFGLDNVDNVKQYIADNNLYVHPTFFYESVWCILGFFVLYIIMKKRRKFSGQLFLCYGVWYGFGRMVLEGLRSDSLYIANTSIRVSQALSAVLMLVSLVLLISLYVKFTKHPKPIEGIDFFPPKSEKELEAEKRKAEKKALKKKARSVVIRDGKIVAGTYEKEAAQQLEEERDDVLVNAEEEIESKEEDGANENN